MQKKPSKRKARNPEAGKHKLWLGYALLAVIVAALLIVNLDIFDESAKVTIDYLEAKRRFADQLSRALSTNPEKFRIAAINGPIYPPGYVLDLDNPIDPLTDKCLLDPGVLKSTAWTPLPEVGLQKTIAVNIGASKIIQQLSNDIAAIGGNVTKSEFGNYKLTDIHQNLASWDDFVTSLAKAECQKGIGGRDVIVVRGQIFAKESMSTSRDLGAEFKTKIIGAGKFLLHVNHKGDFSIEDKEPMPRFHIVSSYSGATRGSIDELLQAPTDEQINILESIDTK